MATKEFVLDVLEVNVNLGCQIAECLLHCIFFVRTYGYVQPLEADIEDLDLSYAKVNDPLLDAEIRKYVRLFQDMQMSGRSNGEICLMFMEKKMRSSGWFMQSTQEENVCWEKWTLRFKFSGMGINSDSNAQLSKNEKLYLRDEVVKRIHYVSKFVKTQSDHVPPVPTKTPNFLTFPYVIEIPSTQASPSVWDNLFKRN